VCDVKVTSEIRENGMFAKEGVKFWLIACEKKSDRFACAPAIYVSSTYRGACTEIFQNLVSAKPFVDIFLAVFGCPIVCEICLSRPEAGADGGGIACRVCGGGVFRTQCVDVGGI